MRFVLDTSESEAYSMGIFILYPLDFIMSIDLLLLKVRVL